MNSVSRGWLQWVFGGGAWTTWYGALFLAVLMLLGVAFCAAQDPTGPSATPFLMLIVYFIAFVIFAVASPVNVVWWAAARGRPLWVRILLVPVTWMLLALLWTFLFWATDPNYPERLLPGRILFPVYSLLIYAANLWLLSRIRAG